MNNVIYKSTITPAHASKDGESPTILYVTKENNGFGVFISDHDEYEKFICWFGQSAQNQAIEFGVQEANSRRKHSLMVTP